MATHVTPKDSNHFVDEYVTDSRLIDEARKAERIAWRSEFAKNRDASSLSAS